MISRSHGKNYLGLACYSQSHLPEDVVTELRKLRINVKSGQTIGVSCRHTVADKEHPPLRTNQQ